MLDVLYNHKMILAAISKQFEERITLGSNATHPIFFSHAMKVHCLFSVADEQECQVNGIKLRWFE